MFKRAVKHPRTWLYAGLLLLIITVVVYTDDRLRSDDEIMERIETTLQQDFESCLAYYNTEPPRTQPKPEFCIACELIYDRKDRLTQWSENDYLPAEKEIKRLLSLDTEPVLKLGNRSYYQLRAGQEDQIRVTLVPLNITYEVVNKYLEPYLFLGRWESTYQKYIGGVDVGVGTNDGDINITGTDGTPAFSVSFLPAIAQRKNSRYAVLILFSLCLICFAIFVRLYTLQHWKYRYRINMSMIGIVLALYGVLRWINIPLNYVAVELFEPGILAFNDNWAPSLGDMTINIFVLAVLLFLLYTHVFRLSLFVYRKIALHPQLAWLTCVLTVGLSVFLISKYVNIFEDITKDSQVAIDFSNIFSTSLYSFLILLDVGILLFSFFMVIFVLLRFNILYGNRLPNRTAFAIFHLGVTAGFCFIFFREAPLIAAFTIFAIAVAMLVLWRMPFKPLLNFDLANYLILITAFTTLITYNVMRGIELKNEINVETISDRILGSQITNTIFAFERSTQTLDASQEEVREQLVATQNQTEFRNWIKDKAFSSNFQGYDVMLFMYDKHGKRLDRDRRQPAIPPDSDFPIEIRGQQVRDSLNLYLVYNYDNSFRDLYVGRFSIILDSTDTRNFIVELYPTSLEPEGVFPLLSIDDQTLEEIELVNSFDHAIYREGILYRKRGKSSFPIRWANDTVKSSQVVGNYMEFVEPLERGKKSRLAVIRYERKGWFNAFTTFSFIFYFYILTTLVLIALPVFLFRMMREDEVGYNMPLRAKIRLGLLVISILPMFVIILIISPFIRQRYYDQASEELTEKAARIANVLGPDFLIMKRDAIGKLVLEEDFAYRLASLETMSEDDVNIFAADGSRIYSTNSILFESGVSTDLMSSEAYEALKTGDRSEQVVEEKVGNLPYFSAYIPIVGKGGVSAGFLNVPFLAQRDLLENEIQDFLAFLANIYLLVFLLLNVVAVLLSNTITRPLAIIQQRLAATGLGASNEPIDYASKDEIGAIVKAYNQMVDKLGDSEKKLSQTQRELAWRQMARQVAHEIKNPLTPMKLSIQHLTRAWNDSSTKLEQMFPRVMQTLLVQIESLVRIANSFSEFARMPETVKSRVAVNSVLDEVVNLYAQHENAMWLIDLPEGDFYAFIDRDQLSRTFNNIIKNALQALEENGVIRISMTVANEKALIEIRDNGKGMSDAIKEKVFEPSFSTKTSGMGLGLAIVRRAIESSGGKIYFETKEGEGTAFFIELPEAEVEQELVHINM